MTTIPGEGVTDRQGIACGFRRSKGLGSRSEGCALGADAVYFGQAALLYAQLEGLPADLSTASLFKYAADEKDNVLTLKRPLQGSSASCRPYVRKSNWAFGC
ncbi:MAG: hypothetical protein Q8P50_06925 [Bacillota bacterium]|nr:hypothetical protein [Bacillota bacterium]